MPRPRDADAPGKPRARQEPALGDAQSDCSTSSESRVVLELEALNGRRWEGVDASARLRRALKALSRVYGFRVRHCSKGGRRWPT